MTMPRFESDHVVPADDLNTMAVALERAGELRVGRSVVTGGPPPAAGARMTAQAFSAVVTSNGSGVLAVTWPEPFDAVAVCHVAQYGGTLNRRIAVNSITSTGGSFTLLSATGSTVANTQVTVQVLVIGWNVGAFEESAP